MVRAAAALLALVSCRGVDMVPTVGAAWHEETQSYSGMVGVSFVPSEVPEVASSGTFRSPAADGLASWRDRWLPRLDIQEPPSPSPSDHPAIEGEGWKVSQQALVAVIGLLTLVGGGVAYRRNAS
ncbi:MAG: hypothetical protein CMH55_07680 [Myxococcales bacterium]|nr:hypothetical protein [Myxococcales bacterium]